MSLIRVRLEATRSQYFPKGSTSHGYEFVAPLKKDGHIDDAPEEEGSLLRVGRGWGFDYEKTDDADEAFVSLDTQGLLPGAFVSIMGHDGIQRPFRVMMMVPWG